MAPAGERDRAREGQHDLGLHALACFLATTALNPWRFDAISAPGCFASAWIAIRYCKQSVSKPVLSSLPCVSHLPGCCFLPSPPHPPGIRIRPAFASAWHSAQSGLVLVQLPARPNPRASSAPRSLGSRASRLLIRLPSFARLVPVCKLSPFASRLRLSDAFVKRRVRLGFVFAKAPVCPSA